MLRLWGGGAGSDEVHYLESQKSHPLPTATAIIGLGPPANASQCLGSPAAPGRMPLFHSTSIAWSFGYETFQSDD